MANDALHVIVSDSAAPRESYRAGALLVLLRLHWFVRLRWLFVAIALGVLAIERYTFPDSRRPWQLLAVVLGVAAVNVLWTALSRLLRQQLKQADAVEDVAGRSERIFANAQVAIDLLLLTGILHFTGGVENPMSVFYLFHVAISGLLLRTWQAVLQCGWAVVLFAVLGVAECRGWIAHYCLLSNLPPPGLYSQPEYALLMVTVIACAVFGVLYFTLRIAQLVELHETQLVRANAALEQSRRAIQDLQLRRARFMQTAAHQLKSPLAIVQTLASLIRDRVVVDQAGIQATCEKISRRAQDGIAQVTELLTFARIQEDDPARHRRAHADVREIVLEQCRRFRPLAESKQIELTVWTPPEGDLFVGVDPRDLRDCVGNLIENAIKYTPGPGKVRVAVTTKRDAGIAKRDAVTAERDAGTAKRGAGQPLYVSIHVSDTGIGFDASLMRSSGKTLGEEPIFDAFRRGPNVIAAGIPGTGLGLSIVREVVEQAGGRIWLMSRPGAGSSFTITLPVSGSDLDALQVRDTRSTKVVLEAPSDTPSAP